MPTLEILLLQLAPGMSPSDPSIIQNMVNVRTALRERVYNTNSRCYQCIEDPSLIFIFGIWPDLATHQAFMASPLKPEILGLQQDQTKFRWMVHIELGSIEELPFEAPVMAIERLKVKSGEHVMGDDRFLESRRQSLVERTKPYNVVDSWICDGELGSQERITISGWESVKDYEVFKMGMAGNTGDHSSGESRFGELKAFYARNMER